MFRIPWKLWRYLEGGKISEFGTEAKHHIIVEESGETLAHQVSLGTELTNLKERLTLLILNNWSALLKLHAIIKRWFENSYKVECTRSDIF